MLKIDYKYIQIFYINEIILIIFKNKKAKVHICTLA